MRLYLVGTRHGNRFMLELLEVLACALRPVVGDVELLLDEFPAPSPDAVNLLVTHEYYGCADQASFPTPDQRARTIALCVENPGTASFEATKSLAAYFPAAVAINRAAVLELRRAGIAAEHFQLGYSELWDDWGGDAGVVRSTDVIYLGSADDRRDALLAEFASYTWDLRCRFLVPPMAPKTYSAADFLVGAERRAALRESSLLVNLHRTGSQGLEWPRVLESMCNGCVVLSEYADDHDPLIPGEHLLFAHARSLPLLVERVLGEPERLHTLRTAAYEFVRRELDMRESCERLATQADSLTRTALESPGPDEPDPAREPIPRVAGAPLSVPPPRTETGRLRTAVRSLSVDTLELRRMVEELLDRESRPPGAKDPEVLYTSPAWNGAQPDVSVLITLRNYSREVRSALGGLAASRYRDFEVLVLDDASTDDSARVAGRFMSEQPWLPARLLHHRVNRGLARSRNALARHARGRYLLTHDADNGVFPTALERLVAALEEDPGATFAYSMIAKLHGDRAVGLLSSNPWDPERLRGGNYIDAMAMIRRDHLLELGGFCEDPRLVGWEDYYLWCQCAEAGYRGVAIPEILMWYRANHHSMLSGVEGDHLTAWSLMQERFGGLHWFDVSA